MKITLKTIHEDLLRIEKLIKPEVAPIISKWTKIGNLEWSEDLGRMSWCDAVNKCKEEGGRLPTIEEWKDLFKNHKKELDEILKSSPDNYYWSATTESYGTQDAWYTGLTDGGTYSSNKTDTIQVRCVR